ncbi:hypothetical protein C4J81_15130 [Deltaproteobacteria bacterium Smac51]|nr:hypothetical protein C4J81_15130 [Deltaproteobacteria bacterium Smac51]
MGMVLEHELTACYAAGSLGGTLGRLNESLRRLSRAHCTGSREKPGGAADDWFIEPARLAHLNQALRLMADAWQSKRTASRWFSNIEDVLDDLKEKTMMRFCEDPDQKTDQRSEYQLLAQALDNLQTEPQFLI